MMNTKTGKRQSFKSILTEIIQHEVNKKVNDWLFSIIFTAFLHFLLHIKQLCQD